MLKALRRQLLPGFVCMAMCAFAAPAMAQDSVATDSALNADTSSNISLINGEYLAPENPVVYNGAGPTASQWQQATADKAYDYRNKQEFVEKPDVPPRDHGIINFIIAILQFFNSTPGKVLLWTFLILLVGYIIYRIVKGQGGGLFSEKDRGQSPDGEALSEQSLLNADWEGRMRAAMQSGDARSAIRFGYLRLLQLLQERGHIAYRADKTNMDYYRELENKPQRQPFRSMARQYEWAWYGNFPPGKEAMDDYLQSFQQIKQSLGAA